MSYVCFYCGKEVRAEIGKRVMCPNCGSKVLIKKRRKIVRNVVAR